MLLLPHLIFLQTHLKMTIQAKKCLIVGPSWVGDMIMAQSLFIKLKQDNPQLVIDVLAPSWSEPMLASMPEVRDSIVMPLGHGKLGLKQRYQLGKSLRNKGYDWAITLPNSLKSALVPFWANIPKRTGYKGEMRYGLINDMRILDKATLTMTVQRFVALGHSLHPDLAPEYEIPRIIIEDSFLNTTLDKFQLETTKPILVFCPGAEYGSAKRWPEKYYAQLGKVMLDRGFQVIILGSEKDKPVATDIVSLTSSTAKLKDLTGTTSLKEVIALLQATTVVVSNDSGLMHIAAAVNTPLVALYGSSDPFFTPPLSHNHAVISLGLECSPCFKRKCPLGTLACLEGITPEAVEESLLNVLLTQGCQ